MKDKVILGYLVFLCLCAAGCTRQVYVPVETVRTEYKDRVNTVEVHDSVTDTHFVYVKGDTVVDWRDRTRWRDREVHDTVREVVRDSVAVPYEVERKLTKWEKAKMDFGGIALGGAGIALLIALLLLIKKIRK